MLYGVYDTKNNYQCVGVFKKRKEVAEFLGTTANMIGSAITRKTKKGRRYIVERIPEEKSEDR